MSYRVRFEGDALVQLNGLPSAAFDALLQRAVDLAGEPWDATVMPPGKDPAYRMTVFGTGYDEIAAAAGIDVRYHTEVTSGGTEGWHGSASRTSRLARPRKWTPVRCSFSSGPRTGWLPSGIERDNW